MLRGGVGLLLAPTDVHHQLLGFADIHLEAPLKSVIVTCRMCHPGGSTTPHAPSNAILLPLKLTEYHKKQLCVRW